MSDTEPLINMAETDVEEVVEAAPKKLKKFKIVDKISENKIYNMDCIDYLKKMNKDTIDTIVLDPPYFNMYISNYNSNSKYIKKSNVKIVKKKF